MMIKTELETAELSRKICEICEIDFKRKYFYSDKEYKDQECWTYEYLNFYEPHNFVMLIELQIDGCIPLGYFIQRSCRISTLERPYHLLNRSYCLDTKHSIISAIKMCQEWKYKTGLEEIENEREKSK